MFDVKMPRTSDDIEESLIVFWHVEEGDSVDEGDVLVEVQTEKAVFEIEAETKGTINEILVKRGGSAQVGEVLARMDAKSEAAQEAGKQEQACTIINEPKSDDSSFVRISPRLRKLAKDLDVSLRAVKGTGNGGAVTETDIREAKGSDSSSEMELSNIRRTIADRMMTSLQKSAQLTLTSWVDVTEIANKREASYSKISWNSLISYAAVRALKQHPYINAHIQGEMIIPHDSVHLGMAVDTDEGLFVPVLRDADQLSLNELDQELKELAKNVMSNQLAGVHLKGSTFTVTNLGSFGIEFFTPIINPPETGILGVGKIEPYLVLEHDKVIQKERLPLSLTFDHRAVDGAPAAKFLQAIADQCQSLIEEL